LPRVQILSPELRGGESFDRVKGRGAFGAEVEIWMRPGDATPARILLRQSDLPGTERIEYRIEVEAVDQPLPPSLFQLAVPKTAVDPFEQARRQVERQRPRRPPNPQLRLRDLEGRIARAPRDAALHFRLAAAFQELGHAGRMVAALRSAVAL